VQLINLVGYPAFKRPAGARGCRQSAADPPGSGDPAPPTRSIDIHPDPSSPTRPSYAPAGY